MIDVGRSNVAQPERSDHGDDVHIDVLAVGALGRGAKSVGDFASQPGLEELGNGQRSVVRPQPAVLRGHELGQRILRLDLRREPAATLLSSAPVEGTQLGGELPAAVPLAASDRPTVVAFGNRA